MLPSAAIFRFPWEIDSGAVKEGESVRSFGRLVCYKPEESKATLSAQYGSQQHHLVVQTTFVEPFHSIVGAQYLVLGEIENSEADGGVVVRARVLNCVDGVNLAHLQRAINVQRTFLTERRESNARTSTPP